jgi:hypothetical protein
MNKGLERLSVCLLAGFVSVLGACGVQEKDDVGTSAGSTERRIDASGSNSNAMDGSEMASRTCEILTPAMVAGVFDVAEATLRQDRIMGCIYSSNADGIELSARLNMLKSHETEAMAAAWFESATRSMSREEAVQFLQGVTEDAKQREEIDTDAKTKVVDDVGGLLSATVGEDGIQFEPVSGIGDDARVNTSEGSLFVREGHLTFSVAAYHGPTQPAPDLKGVAIKDMAKAALRANKDWIRGTVPQRTADATKLALAVVEALPR